MACDPHIHMGNVACTDRGKKPYMPPSPRLDDPPEPMMLGFLPYPPMPEVPKFEPQMPDVCVRALDKVPKMPSIPLPPLPAIPGWGNKSTDNAVPDIISIFRGQQGQDGEEIRELSRAIDLDKLNIAFLTYAGPDQCMDLNEYTTFMRRLGLSQEIADRLWKLLDMDRNGIVDSDEFSKTLLALANARAWLRYCPECEFRNACDFCQSIEECENCTRETFCPRHWAEHPSNEQPDELRDKLNT